MPDSVRIASPKDSLETLHSDLPQHYFNGELRCSILSTLLVQAYRVPVNRRLVMAMAKRLEGGHFFSLTMRRVLYRYHGVEVGAYSYGECMQPGSLPPGTSVGRYASIARDILVLPINHPIERLSMHPFFYRARLGFLEKDSIQSEMTFRIDHDAWVGARAIFTKGCSRVGIGAVVGAGAVVTHDVPDFTIVAGNPAKVLRHRFDPAICKAILASEWWKLSIEECASHHDAMSCALPTDPYDHPLIKLENKGQG